MGKGAEALEQALRRDIDSNATVEARAANLSAYLASAYTLYEATLLGERIVLAEPAELGESVGKTAKRAEALGRALGEPAALCFPTLSGSERRALVERGVPFATRDGDYYLPALALSLSAKATSAVERIRPFSPAQQAVYLYCLYAGDGPFAQSDVQGALGLSSGSVSSALSLLVRLGLVDFVEGGRTGRRKSYRVRDAGRLYREGVGRFGTPVRETVVAPSSAARGGWLKAGLSALAERSDLLPPERPAFAVSPAQAGAILGRGGDPDDLCSVKVLRYDPAPFASSGCVDPLTMLLTVGEEDERISLALGQALRSCEWYLG